VNLTPFSLHQQNTVCLSVRINANTSETIKARKLGLGMQVLEVLGQRKFA